MRDNKRMSKKLRYALILDTETTGFDPETDALIELAVMLFDLKHAQAVESYASLVWRDRNEAEHVNGIPVAMLKTAPYIEDVWIPVRNMIQRKGLAPQVVIAHNAEFDRQFTPELGLPWVCSEEDIRWPHRQARGGSLVQLALSLGLGVASAHRAMADVDTLARIFTRLAEQGHDLPKLIEHAMRPKALFYAVVSYQEKDAAKQHGFRWDPDKKEWWRRMAVDDAKALPFKVKRVKEISNG